MAFVYILQFPSGTYYVGSTTSLDVRLRHHKGGHTPSTKALGGKTARLVLKQEYRTLSEARSIERRLKNLKRKDYIARMVADGYIKITP